MSTEVIKPKPTEMTEEQAAFDLAQRKAKVYSTSTLVPKEYRDNIGNVLVAQNMAHRLGADLLMVMQNLYVVHGNPGWSAKFLIACFNQCGRFAAIKYKFTGKKGTESWGCIAHTTELATGEVIEGTEVTIKMAKDEGWSTKNGSKWKTMPELMLRYRSATFLVRTTAPEIGMGLMTHEEIDDMRTIEGEVAPSTSIKDVLLELNGGGVSEEATVTTSTENLFEKENDAEQYE